MRLIALCAAALGGAAVGDVSHLERWRLGFGALVALLGAGLAWRRPAVRMLALATCAAALGGLRAAVVPVESAAALEGYDGQSVRLRGEVVQPPTIGPAAAQLLVDAQSIGAAGSDPLPLPTATSLVRVRVVGDPATLGGLAQGDALVLEGRLLAGA